MILFPATNQILTLARICVHVNNIVKCTYWYVGVILGLIQSDQVSAVSTEQSTEALPELKSTPSEVAVRGCYIL